MANVESPDQDVKLEVLHLNALNTADGFDRLAEILEAEPGLQAAAAKLRERATKLREGRFTFLIVGEFKRGKSTLLNAMMGADLLPRKAAPCTALLTSVRYGPKPAVRVLFANGRVETPTHEEFTDKYELKVEDVVGSENAEAAYYEAMCDDRFKDIEMAEVEYPLELCKHGVEVVDSPGLAENAVRERRTLAYLRDADAVIMVLDAQSFLNQRELAFIRDRLTPLGLKNNLFFLINRWNLLAHGLIRKNDPDEAKRNFGDLFKLIDQRLKPLCNIGGKDLSAQRIFKIDALGALRERMAATSASALEETQVPAFERSLARFLVEERVMARQTADRSHLSDATEAVENHCRTIDANLDNSLEEVKTKFAALQPKLEELHRVGVHIKNALTAMASDVADQMIKSFDLHVEEKIRTPLPAAVEKFSLGRIDSLFVSFDAAMDIFRKEGEKFKDGITAHLKPQIANYLRPRVLEWVSTVDKTYLPGVAKRVEAELRTEAKIYAGILGEVGNTIGGHFQGSSMNDILHKWLKDFGGPDAVDVGVDIAPLLAGVIADITAELTLQMSAHVLPGVGLLISAILVLWRRNRFQANVRKQILEGMNTKLTDFTVTQHEAIRDALREGFAKLENAIGGKIREQIAQIDGDMRSLIEQRENGEADANTSRKQLANLQSRVDQEAQDIVALLQ